MTEEKEGENQSKSTHYPRAAEVAVGYVLQSKLDEKRQDGQEINLDR